MNEVAPGILWLRLALPYRLDHVNVYLIEDGAGFAVLDTGLDDAPTRAAWEALLAGPLAGRPLTRVLVTHYHPDHIGLAGWLCDRFGLSLLMSQTEYLVSLAIHLDPGALNAEPYRSFYRSHGLDAGITERRTDPARADFAICFTENHFQLLIRHQLRLNLSI